MSNKSTENHPHGNILIVDDNTSNLKTLTDILNVTGYQVQSAIDGESALQKVKEKQPELILLDYKMAGMNGIEVCQHLKSNPKTKTIPIIFISAHGDAELKIKAIETGGIDYVLKPINPLELLAKIENHLKVFRLQQQLIQQSRKLTKEIKHRKKMEEQLLQNEKYVAIAGLAAGVAHEINTPLSGILQALQLVEIGLSPEDAESRTKAAQWNVDLDAVQKYFKSNELEFFLNGIRESALKASHIVKVLLEFSRPHEGKFSPANLEEIIEKCLLLTRSDYDMKQKYTISNLQLVTEFDPNLSEVSCVTQEIEQVLLNLIKNSAQSLAESTIERNPRITLRTVANSGMANIEVEDNGAGITEDVKSKIFDPFFTTRDVGDGRGLGLSVSQAIVNKHNGTIRVESVPGKGAKFIVELPLHQDN